MTFLESGLLWGLPFIALPLIIHLINQRRHRTVDWGAMMFLLKAKRMSKGMARLRHMLIMAARMLVIAGLVIAVSRPMATGNFSNMMGGRPETVIVLLDRSASMQQQELATKETKLSAGLGKIVDRLETVGGSTQLVLVENTEKIAYEISSPQALLNYPKVTDTDSVSDIPAMMQVALDYIVENESGRTDIWICSDARENDWDPDSSRWETLRSAYAKLDGIRFHVLNYTEKPVDNLAVWVDRVEHVVGQDKVELLLDIRVKRSGDLSLVEDVPIEITVNGTTFVEHGTFEEDSDVYLLAGHRITMEKNTPLGWGKVEVAADSNVSDNVFYFTFAETPVYQTAIVSDDANLARVFDIFCSNAPEAAGQQQSQVVTPGQLNEVDWEQTALVIWHANLPTETQSRQIASFIDSGRTVVFFPPAQVDATESAGASWGEWSDLQEDEQTIGYCRHEEDVMKRTINGKALPVENLKVFRICDLKTEGRVLAKLKNGQPLIVRQATDAGGVYYCATLPSGTHSTLVRNGVTLYVMLQRALANGAASLGAAKILVAGTNPAQRVENLPLLNSRQDNMKEGSVISATRPVTAGIYGDENQYVALNRSDVEDVATVMADTEVNALFDGLDAHLITGEIGSLRSLANEIWRLFIVVMGIALFAEALLCLPPRVPATTSASLLASN